jgi:hypothetical protein
MMLAKVCLRWLKRIFFSPARFESVFPGSDPGDAANALKLQKTLLAIQRAGSFVAEELAKELCKRVLY